MRPHTTYKAFGGVLAAIGLASALLILLRDTPPGGGAPPPLTYAIVPGVLGLVGLYVFNASNAKLKHHAEENALKRKPRVDVKSMVIAFVLLLLFVGLAAFTKP
jgi:hypothetical protein